MYMFKRCDISSATHPPKQLEKPPNQLFFYSTFIHLIDEKLAVLLQ